MKSASRIAWLTLIVLLGGISIQGIAATRLEEFNTVLVDAYASYRTALFQSNNQERDKSRVAVQEFQRQWQVIIDRYADAPPEVYASDPSWKRTVQRIAEIAAAGLQEIEHGRVGEGHEVLEAIRDELVRLRARNGVYVFSDAINAYHGVMEGVLGQKPTPATLDSQARTNLREKLGVLLYLAEDIRDRTPPDNRGNKEYEQLLQGLFDSIAALRAALDTGDPDSVAKAIKALKPAYAKLFLKFG